ncbi:MAG: hypothetical protein GXP22_02935 [Gammaproteobacteria bacterium]|nr:hypothetical protein [Gammaproteobacteria bacterium]
MLFSNKPGRHERHLHRKHNNPLFNNPPIDQQDIHLAQQEDQQEINLFMDKFRKLVQRSVELDANVDADILLTLKEDLDKIYEQSAGLAGDQSDIKGMIKRLIDTIMKGIWSGIGNDTLAKSKLEMEEEAREAHFELLEHPLIADLLCTDSVIAENELAPTLLTASSHEIDLILPLFTTEQQKFLFNKLTDCLNNIDTSQAIYADTLAKIEKIRLMRQ